MYKISKRYNNKGRKIGSVDANNFVYEGDIAVDVVSPFEIFPISSILEPVTHTESLWKSSFAKKEAVVFKLEKGT